MTRRTLIRAALAAGALSVGAARAQSDYPSRTIRWIVPYQPGTAPDMTVRVVAEAMAEALRQPVIVDNKGGAGGNIGAQQAARAPADGYTWLYSATPMAINMRLHKAPGFDTLKDFVHVSRIGASDVLLVVHADAGIRSARELIERARREPGRLNYGSGGVGTPAHLGAELMLGVAGVQATHVPFKGAVEAVNAVIGRQVDFSLPIFQVALPHVQAGRLLALGVAGPRRNPKLPAVPTLEEEGLAGVSLQSFGGLSLPAGTPAPVVAKLGETLRRVLERPDVRARLEAGGGFAAWSTPEQYTEDLRREIAQTERMMKLAKLEPQ
jgi:tripartite-type tricarboxylate transporter receptor subunit TctC